MNTANEIKKIEERLRKLYDTQYVLEQNGRNNTYVEDLIFELETKRGILKEEAKKNSIIKEEVK